MFTARNIQSKVCIKDVRDRTTAGYLTKVTSSTSTVGKKGLLVKKDMTARTRFSRKVIKSLPEDFWMERISFYFDGVGFIHETNPLHKARAAGAMVWR